jgi:UDP-N-acetylmuramyl pentapeptide synthase
MVARIAADFRAGDIVLIKGSRKIALDQVVEGLVRITA